MRAIFALLLSFGLLTSPLLPQQEDPPRKPVLIRVDPGEKEEEGFIPDPSQAPEHVSVGDFYFRRNNLKAAEDRYREAILHDPKLVEAYEKLIRTLERKGEFEEALEVTRSFLEVNSDSLKAPDFQALKRRFETLARNE